MESDSDDWPVRAAADSALVATALLQLTRASWPPSPPPTKWGRRARRSGAVTAPPPRIDRGKKVRRRLSPMTPLEYRACCGTSESGSEEIAAVLTGSGTSAATGGGRGGGREPKVVNAGDSQPSGFRISDAKRIRRSSATIKKPALPELHAMYRSLLEYRESLLKELEVRRRVKAALVSKNIGLERLQTSLESQKRSITAAQMPEEMHPKRLRSCNTFEELPDLNIAVIGETD